ncbi:MAG TPA: tail fiber protein [Gemmataceae bacterium]|jgi:microcystin-dependent protein|nr:tail fiber protein [Gemmataceae bacterium]
MDPFLGEIRIFAGNFAPKNWALCNGQILPISQNTALFSLLGTNYGGNGTSNFALPNLQGCTAMDQGNGPGLTPRVVGETGGSQNVTLLVSNLPAHSHSFTGQSFLGDLNPPGGNYVAGNRSVFGYLVPGTPNSNIQPMNPAAIAPAGSGLPHNNMQPYLGINYIICMAGVFPSRN